jgi:S1-C subfamily serine protease
MALVDPYGDSGTTPAAPTPPTQNPPVPQIGGGVAIPEGEIAAAPLEKSEERKVSRHELDQALADFEALKKEVQFKRTNGGILILELSQNSFLFRMGLRKGDVVESVAGRPIDTPEQAADAYVKITVADRFELVVRRGETRLTVRYVVI